MSKSLPVLALFLLSCIPHAFAQTSTQLIPSGQWLTEGDKLYDSGQNNKAREIFSRIDRNDTNYVRSLYGISLTYYADSQFDASVKYSRMALSEGTDPEKEPDLYCQYANATDAAGAPQKAIAICDSGLKKYPVYTLLYINKGAFLTQMGRYAEAEAVFKQSLLIDPYSGAHYRLGLIALNEGKLVPAFFSFLGYLLMSPDGKYYANTINLLNAIAKNEDNIRELIDKRKEEPSDNYRTLEQILQSKIALDKNYKPLIRLDDPISRQIQVIFEKMEFQEDDNDFWMQYYVPYFKTVFTSNQFENFINHIFSNANVALIQEYNKKNKKDLDAFVANAADYFNLIRITRELTYKKRSMEGVNNIYSHGLLTGRGNYHSKEDKLTGPWEFYYSTGNLKAKGVYNEDGKREGPFLYYYYDGTLKEKELYANGKLEGEDIINFSNGAISTHSFYKNGLLEGESISYFLTGIPHEITHYHEGKEEGVKLSFYLTGDTASVENYTAGELDGETRTWNNNRTLASIIHYKKDKLDGAYTKYFNDGRVRLEGTYAAGKQIGLWKDYHPNGQLKSTQNYTNDKAEGEYKEFFENGLLSNSYNNRNGKTVGEIRYNDEDGKLYVIYTYANDQIQKVQYFDKTGKQISMTERQNKTLDLTRLGPDGAPKNRTTYNEKGNVIGTQKYFYSSGKIAETDEYDNGSEEGPSISYYANGEKKQENMYSGAKLNGYHRTYYAHGQLAEEGWNADDNAVGNWLAYNELGRLTDSTYYREGYLHGYKTSFFPDGRKDDEIKYRSGWLQEWTQYDSLGKILQQNHFKDGTGKVLLVYPDGKPSLKLEYKHGQPEGPRNTWYFDGKRTEESFYLRGLLEGSYKAWFYSGSLSTEGQFKAGERTGVWKTYRENGKLKRTTEYSFGSLNGKDTWYYENGRPETEIAYKDGNKNGLYRYFTPEGILIYQVMYKKNSPVSYSYLDKRDSLLPPIAIEKETARIKTYFPNGTVSAELEYKDGFLDGDYKLYYPNGQLYIQKHRSYGNLEGEQIEYYSNGKVHTRTPYLHDSEHGTYKEYNEKGILIEEWNFYLDSPHGLTRRFDGNGKLRANYYYYYGRLLSVKNE